MRSDETIEHDSHRTPEEEPQDDLIPSSSAAGDSSNRKLDFSDIERLQYCNILLKLAGNGPDEPKRLQILIKANLCWNYSCMDLLDGYTYRLFSSVSLSGSLFGLLIRTIYSELLYSSFCLYVWGQLPIKLNTLSKIKQFILFYAAHYITTLFK